jgi:hypothetical protein
MVLSLLLLPVTSHAQDDAGTKPLMFGTPPNHAVTKSLIPAAKKVAEAYAAMKNHPGDSLYEVQYLLAFPHDWQTFQKVYNSENASQLYYEMPRQVGLAMRDLSKKHPELVGIDLMQLGKQVDYAFPNISDGPEMLQHTIVEYAVGNIRLFIQLFDQFSKAEKKRLVTMLANVENFDNRFYPYETLIAKLESAGAKDIATRLKQAKTDRIKKGH